MKHHHGKEDHVMHLQGKNVKQGKKTLQSLPLVNFSSGGHFLQPSETILAIW